MSHYLLFFFSQSSGSLCRDASILPKECDSSRPARLLVSSTLLRCDWFTNKSHDPSTGSTECSPTTISNTTPRSKHFDAQEFYDVEKGKCEK